MNEKQIVNTITWLRIVILPIIYFFLFTNNKYTAIILIVIAGFSDVLDGLLARYWNVADNNGAKLDSQADYLYYISYSLWLLLFFPQLIKSNLIFIVIGLLFTLFVFCVMYLRKQKMLFEHLQASRIAAIMFFITMILLLFGFEDNIFFRITILFWVIAQSEILLFIHKGVSFSKLFEKLIK